MPMTRYVAAALLAGLALLLPADLQARQPQPGWLRAEVGAQTDNQPRNAQRVAAELGRFLGANATAAATLRVDRTAGDGADVQTSTAEPGARMTLGVPALRLGLEAAAGALVGGTADGATGVFALGARLGLGQELALRAGTTRDRYALTLASLDTLLMRQTYEAALDRSGATGWAFALIGRQERFGDGNPVNTGYGWLLAPVAASATQRLRLGYSLAMQDAAESRWVADAAPRRGRGHGRPNQGADTIPGRYAPYYTPHDVVVHGVLAEGTTAIGTAWLVVNANVAVWARETAPRLERLAPAPAPPTLVFDQRTFRPMQLVGTLSVPVGAVAVRFEARHDRTAYYRATGARVILSRNVGGG